MLTSRVVLGRRYELDTRIGAGGFSEVWRATDLTLSRPVAVKLLYAGYAQHDETLARFRAEARHAGRLTHENIARVYDYGEPDGDHPPFLVMELVDGPPLSEVLTGGPLNPVRAARILAQAAAGLAAAHDAGLVHRDIKPGNLLIGPRGVVKITDFGIARAAGSAPLTSTGMLVGTPGYLAPERATGSPATPAADLYALGIVAYECLAGGPPFTGTPLEVIRAHCSEDLPDLPPSVPADLAALISQLAARQPERRPASATLVAMQAGQIAERAATGTGGVAGTAGAATTAGGPLPPAGLLPAAAAQWPGEPDAGNPGQPTARLTSLPGAAWDPYAYPDTGDPAAGQPGPRRGRRLVLGLAAIALIVIAAVAVASQLGGPQRTGNGQSPGTQQSAAVVTVRPAELIGRRVGVVARHLRQRGLVVRVRWQRGPSAPPRTVLGVLPAGRLPVGSQVVLTGALPPPGHDKGDGNDQGNGHHKGHGGD
ncbi:MAG TPA: serine/threonine-protein kinase [Streptosporangiaceae bacterium]|nr:serine/threonine-protein kinase [Streptosporangiaceae bacterium]